MIMGSQTDKDGLLVFHHAWKGALRAFWTVGALGQTQKSERTLTVNSATYMQSEPAASLFYFDKLLKICSYLDNGE